MSGPNGHARAEDAAAYARGALEPADADEFRRHLTECEACREEVAAYAAGSMDPEAQVAELEWLRSKEAPKKDV